MAAGDSAALSAEAARRIEAVVARLRGVVGDHRAGFTAPPAKAFKDRRPLAFAVLLMFIGAVLGHLVTGAAKLVLGISPTAEAR